MTHLNKLDSQFARLFASTYYDLFLSPMTNAHLSQNHPTATNNEFTAFLFSNRDVFLGLLTTVKNRMTLASILESLFFTQIYEMNQFVDIPENYHEGIKELYQSLIERLFENLNNLNSLAAVSSILSEHFQVLLFKIEEIKKFYPERDLQKSPIICSEYSADLQLKLLSINLGDLKEPILDIGCGKNAVLLQYLTSQGFHVVGIDRNLTHLNGNLLSCDWLQFNYEKNTWGTIISQMAFSNHFIFNHLSRNGKPELYAKIYMKILAALKSGGSFYYTPGVPFIEQHLPKTKYHIFKTQIDYPMSDQNKQRHRFNKTYLYSVKITKVI